MAKKSRRLSDRIKELIRKLRSVKSAKLEDFERAGIELQPFSEGVFRSVYFVKGLPIVVKIPHLNCCYHSRTEIRRLRQIRRSSLYRVFKRYMPKVYYSDEKLGIIAMRRYLKRNLKGDRWWIQDEILDRLFHDALGGQYSDYLADNFCIDGRGQLKIVDLGF